MEATLVFTDGVITLECKLYGIYADQVLNDCRRRGYELHHPPDPKTMDEGELFGYARDRGLTTTQIFKLADYVSKGFQK